MSRTPASPASERRVARLVELLLGGIGDDRGAVASIANSAGLGHETVRQLIRNPGGRKRSSPAFFVVAAIARARGISLDYLASETLDAAREETQP